MRPVCMRTENTDELHVLLALREDINTHQKRCLLSTYYARHGDSGSDFKEPRVHREERGEIINHNKIGQVP